ncbi:hypothetical protein H2248_011579 [Termitomyces sp. 'cryptogamus']|nr:hypothetical protein H2248_011579 [Termitomyces sp. 'cryptogamus']
MLRRSRYSPTHVFRKLGSRQRPIVGLAIAAVGTFVYARRVIQADSSEDDPGLIIYTLLSQPDSLIATPTAIYRSSDPDPEQEKADEQTMVKMGLDALTDSGTIDGNTGIRRFYSASVPSSAPRLDSTLLSSNKMSTHSSWTIFTLHEGFLGSGWFNMQVLSRGLHASVFGNLIGLLSKYEHSPEHSDVGSMMTYVEEVQEDGFENAVCQTLKQTFLDMDNLMVHHPVESLASSPPPSKTSIIASIGAAIPGSSALVAFYDHDPRKLRVANTGSTRAVLGRKSGPKDNDHQTYSVHILSEDHTSNMAPGLFRAFGLGPYKWSLDVQKRLHRDFMGDPPLESSLEGPITAEPSVVTIDIQPGDFLVMGTSGLWNSLTNDEVVGLVGLWLNRRMTSVNNDAPLSQYQEVFLPSDLPAPVGADNTTMYQRWGVKKRFICVDNNVAQHLSRNALGGADVSWTATLLAHTPPRSSKLRDDVTVTVVLFNDNSW